MLVLQTRCTAVANPHLQHRHAVVWLAEERQGCVVHKHALAQLAAQTGQVLQGGSDREGQGGERG